MLEFRFAEKRVDESLGELRRVDKVRSGEKQTKKSIKAVVRY